jgi:hypothetical protein
MGNNQPKEVFNIIESQEGKAKWLRVGAAFVNRDGSINVLLNTYPSEGKLQIRDRRKNSKDGAA